MGVLDYALVYAARGWRVMPIFTMENGMCSCKNPRCISPGKHPMISNWDANATTEVGQIKEWWGQRPDANIAIATGKESGIWSLDVDGREGLESMSQLVSDGRAVPLSFWFKTGGGGRQVFFTYPGSGREVRNRVGIFNGVDVRGENGYVVAPPSRHASGNHYKLTVPMNLPVVDAPDWMLETVTNRKEIVLAPGNGGLIVTNGRRNMELFTMGAKLRETFPGINPSVVQRFLESVNENHCEEPLSGSEILSITRNIWKYSR